MADYRDQMMEWVLGRLRGGVDEGTEIATLLGELGRAFPISDRYEANTIWKSLIARDDIFFNDGCSNIPLSASFLGNLGLEEVWAAGLRGEKIRIHEPAVAAQSMAVGSITNSNSRSGPNAKRRASKELIADAPIKRPRRPPPKTKGADSTQISQALQDRSPSPILPKRRGRPSTSKSPLRSFPASSNLVKITKPRKTGGASRSIQDISSEALQEAVKLDSTLNSTLVVPSKFDGALQEIEALRSSLAQEAQAGLPLLGIQDLAVNIVPIAQDLRPEATEPSHIVQNPDNTREPSVSPDQPVGGKDDASGVQQSQSRSPQIVRSAGFDELSGNLSPVETLTEVVVIGPVQETLSTVTIIDKHLGDGVANAFPEIQPKETQIHQVQPVEETEKPVLRPTVVTNDLEPGATNDTPPVRTEGEEALCLFTWQASIHLGDSEIHSPSQQDQGSDTRASATAQKPLNTLSVAVQLSQDSYQTQADSSYHLPTIPSGDGVAGSEARRDGEQAVEKQTSGSPVRKMNSPIVADIDEGIHRPQSQPMDEALTMTSNTRAQQDVTAACSTTSSDIETPVKRHKYNRRGAQDPRNKPYGPRTKQSIYTSYEDLQYEIGADGVYIDPPGSEREHVGRLESSVIAVLKSSKLKDSRWLDEHKGSWVDVVASTIANKLLDVKDNTLSPKRKSQKSGRSDTMPKKRGRPRKQATSDSVTADQVASPTAVITQADNQARARSLSLLGKPLQVPGDPFFSQPELSSIQVHNESKAMLGSIRPLSSDLLSQFASQTIIMPSASYSRSRTSSVEPTQVPNIISEPPPLGNSAQADFASAQTQMGSQVSSIQTEAVNHQQNTTGIRNYQSPYSTQAVSITSELNGHASGSLRSSTHQQAHLRRESGKPETAAENLSAHRPPRTGTFQSSRRPSISINQSQQPDAFCNPPTAHKLGSFSPIFSSRASHNALSGFGHTPHIAASPIPSKQAIEPSQNYRASEDPHGSFSQPQTIGCTDSKGLEYPPHPGHHYGQFPRPTYMPDIASWRPLPAPSNHHPMPSSRNTYSSPYSHPQPQQPYPYQHMSRASPDAHQRQVMYGDQFSARSRLTQDVLASPDPPVLCSKNSSAQDQPSIQPTTISQSPSIKKFKKSQRLSSESGLIDAFAGAEAVSFPEDIIRLACIYEGSDGNLILSKDKTLLQFYPVARHPPEASKLSLSISTVKQNPITSVAGSKPMELRIKTREINGAEKIFKFSFSSTKVGCAKANEMRTKIVTAIIASRFRAGDTYERPDEAQLAILKPFYCEKCDARFKNKEGLAYHVTKSYTTCNPNLENMPRSKKPGRAARPKPSPTPNKTLGRDLKQSATSTKTHAIPSKTQSPTVENHPVITNGKLDLGTPKGDTEGDAAHSDSSYSSEDSIVEWSKKNATTDIPVPTYSTKSIGRGNVSGNTLGYSHPKQRDYKIETFKPTKRRYKSLAGEAIVLQNVLETIKTSDFDERAPATTFKVTSSQITAADIANSSFPSDLFSKRGCAKLIMALIEGHNGMFICGKSLFIAAIAVCIAKKPALSRLPPSRLFNRTLDELIAEEQLLEEEFEYIDNKARGTIIRSLVRLPAIPPRSERFHNLRKLALACHPAAYVPSQFCPPQPILEKLQALGANVTKRFAIDGELDKESENEVQILPRTRVRGKAGGRERIRPVVRIDSENDLGTLMDEDPGADKTIEDQMNINSRRAHLTSRLSRFHGGSDAAEDFESSVEQGLEPEEYFEESDPDADDEPDLDNGFDSDRGADSSDGDDFNPNQRRQSGGWIFGRRKSQAHRAAITQGLEKYWAEKRGGQSYAGPYRSKRKPGAMNLSSPQRKGSLALEEGEKSNGTRLVNSLEAERRQQMWSQAPAFMPSPYTGAWNIEPVKVKMFKLPRTYHTRRPGLVEPITFIQASNGAWSERPFGHGVKPVYCRPAKRVEGNPSHRLYLKGLLNGHRPIMYPPEKNRMYGPAAPSKAFLKKMTEQSPNGPDKPETAPRRRGGRRKKTTTEISPPTVEVPENLPPELSAHECAILRYPKRSTRPKASVVDFTNLAEVDALSYEQPIDLIAADHLSQWLQGPSTVPGCLEPQANEDGPAAKRQKGLDDSFIPRPHQSGRTKNRQATRAVVHLTTDFEGLGEDLKIVAREMAIEIIEPAPVRKRMTKQKDAMSPAVEIRFMVAVVVIRSLTGGVESLIDWMLVSTIFQDLSPNYLTKFWRSIVVDRKHIIDRLTIEFQDKFPAAYGNGDFPSLDYDNLVNYNWNFVVDWAIQNLDTCLNKNLIDLPESRNAMEARFDQKVVDKDEENWRQTFMQPLIPIYKRFEMAGGETLSVSIGPQRLPMEDEYELMVAKTFCRAIALTPETDYDHAGAIGKLTQLNLDVVNLAIKNLTDTKVIMHRKSDRNVLGKRMYEATDVFANPLRQHVKETQLVEATEYKTDLDANLRNEGRVRIDYAANEGAVMCITSLMAAGRITLVPIDPPANKYGLTGGGYETKGIPREKLRFEIDIIPTNSYIFDIDNDLLATFLQQQPPVGEDERIPVWYSISGQLIPSLWRMVLLSVGQVLAFRAGIGMDALLKTFKPTIDEWEMKVLLEWGLGVGLWRKLGGRVDGWMVNEWWWLMIGRSCIT